VGSAATDGGAVTFFKTTTPAATAYVQTSAGGIYQLDGVANAHVVAVAFHPDHGFAYATGVDEDGDGDLALNLAMGHTGTFNVQAQVVDGVGTPVASQVLDPTRQFRLRLRTPYDLSAEVNSVVSAHALFPTFSGTPSDLQPQTKLLTVQSTGVGGIADGTLSVAGGAYVLDLLKIDTNDPATALVTSTNPLPLAGNATVVVRVN